MADQETPEIIPPFKGDGDGFLVGSKIDGRELTEEFQRFGDSLTSIEKSVAAIEKAMTGAGLRVLKGAEKAAEPVGAASTQAARANTPRASAEKPVSQAKQSAETAKAVEKGVTKAMTAAQAKTRKAVQPDKVVTIADEKPLPAANGSKVSAGNAAAVPEVLAEPSVDTVAEPTALKARRKRQAAEGGEAPQTPAVRDAKGRFVGKDKKAGGSGGESDNSMAGYEDDKAASNFADKLADAVRDSADDARQTDPVVQAIGEVAEPVSHAFGAVKGLWQADDGEEGLLKRILSGLTRFRREQSAFNKAEKKTLAGIENNTDELDKLKAGGSGGGTSFNFLGGLGKGMGGKLAGLGAGALKMARKLPIIGSLFAVGKGLFDVANSEWDTTTTREQKDKQTGGAIGDAAGIIAGGFAGAKMGALAGSFLGPIGSAIGGVVGSAAGMFFGSSAGKIVGEKVGGWVSELRKMDIGGAITGAWDTCVATVQDAWNGCIDGVSNAWNGTVEAVSGMWTSAVDTITGAWTSFTDTLSNAWTSLLDGVSGFWDKAKEGATAQLNNVNEWIKDKTGVDVGGSVSAVAQTVSGAFKGVVGMVKEAVSGKKDEAPSWKLKNSGKLFDLGVKREQEKLDPKTWQLGDSSAKFESGDNGAGTISKGLGDRGGKSYGTYQLSSKTGTLRQFLKESPYGKQFEGMREGSSAFDRRWQKLAESDPAFAQAQHDFIKRTHYDKAVSGLKDAGLDLSGRGKAVQDAIWSTSVQFGAGQKDGKTGAVPLFQKALGDRNIADMSDEQIISAIQDYKLANNDKLFRGSSANIREGTAKRAVLEKQRLLALSRLENPEQATAETPDAASPAKGPTIAARAQMEAEKARNVSEADAIWYSQMTQRFGLDKRARTDGGDWRKDFGLDRAATPNPVISAARIPETPPLSVNVPAPAKSTPMQTPLNSTGKPAVTAVRVESDAGQDVQERGIAHIVTGGLS